MIGTWRWFLALLVVVGHLYSPWWPASFGVFSFYLISGFLMTLILNERYHFGHDGLLLFWKNRLLRIFPPYYVACLFSIAVLLIVPREQVVPFNDKLIFPTTWFEWLTNLDILGLQEIAHRSSLVPPAWSLSIELVYYAVIALWAGRSRKRARLFLFLGLAYLMAIHFVAADDWWYRYFHVGAGALPFAVGVNVYFERRRILALSDRISFHHRTAFALLAYFGVFVCARQLGHVRTLFFYLNIVTTALLLPVLWGTRIQRLKRWDTFLGNLSYPTYLFHWQVGILVVFLLGAHFKGPVAFVTSTLIVTLISILESRWISGRLEKLRRRNKERVVDGNAVDDQVHAALGAASYPGMEAVSADVQNR